MPKDGAGTSLFRVKMAWCLPFLIGGALCTSTEVVDASTSGVLNTHVTKEPPRREVWQFTRISEASLRV